jgi:hypothetical protein
VVEGARLESVYTRKGIAGSNPALSADNLINLYQKPVKRSVYGLFDFWTCRFVPFYFVISVSNS